MKKLIILFFAISIFWSCDDYLDVDPKNTLTLKTYDDAKALMGAYLRSLSHSEQLEDMQSRRELKNPLTSSTIDNYLVFQYYSDDLDVDKYLTDSWTARNNEGLFLQSLDLYEGSIHERLWKDLYSNIGFCNQILQELKAFEAEKSEDELNIIKAEAKFIRAYQLFKLMQYFSPYNNNELGLPLNLEANEVSSYDRGRKTQTEVYEIIIRDLEDVLAYTTNPTDYNVFFDKEIIKGLLAKIYHFKAGSGAGSNDDYDKAISYAKEVLAGKSLMTTDNFSELFAFDYGNYGVVKESGHSLVVYNPIKWYNGGFFNIVSRVAWRLDIFCTQELFDLYDDNDIRKSNDVGATGAFVAEGNVITKFSNIADDYAQYFLRTAELQLIVAESYARLGDEGNAKTYLEEFQAARIFDYTGYSGGNILQEILDERRREFCFEYDMRWTDLVRLQTGFTRSALDKIEEGQVYTIEDGDYRFTQPIPQTEELENNNQIEQNPGWSIF